jgi:hypothetical protein
VLGGKMAIAIKISDSLISDARIYSKVNHRSLTGQIEFWAKIGKCSEENPDLTYAQIKEILPYQEKEVKKVVKEAQENEKKG